MIQWQVSLREDKRRERFGAMRGPGESCSDVILRLAKVDPQRPEFPLFASL